MAIQSKNQSITLAITGASGVQYGLRLLTCLIQANRQVSVLMSSAAFSVAALELSLELPKQTHKLALMLTEYCGAKSGQINVYGDVEWTASIASGSSGAQKMVVCPCSSGTLSAIATGASNNLIERAADVMLKERRQLILVPRETPLSVIHLENMLKLAQMGVHIIPAMPGFYHRPETVEALIDFVVARVLDQLDVSHDLLPRWGESLQS